MKRLNYKPKERNTLNISFQNEPRDGYACYVNTREYPDMYSVYTTFAKTYQIPLDNFILTNGCENAFRITLLALKPEEMLLESPGWKLAEVICNSLDIPYKKIPYHYDDMKFYLEKNCLFTWLYATDEFNNLFKHEPCPLAYDNVILDETYTLNNLLDKNRRLNKHRIIIGSFSKFAGCGLRLGYVLFHKCYNDKFQMLREQYLSTAACQYILSGNMIHEKKELPQERFPIVTNHYVYTTMLEEPTLPHKTFELDGHIFYRVGK